MKFEWFPKPMTGFLKVTLYVSLVCHLTVCPFMVYFGKIKLVELLMALLMDALFICYFCLCRKDGDGNGDGTEKMDVR